MSTNEVKHTPSTMAMKAAVAMEIHAVCNTRTDEKASAIDAHFPAYEQMLAALKAFNLTEEMIVGGTADSLVVRLPMSAITQAAAAVAAAEGRP